MAFQYTQTKGFDAPGHQIKTDAEWSLTTDQLQNILANVEKSGRSEFNANWVRDHALICMGFYLGLRIGEAIILERRHFERLYEDGTVSIPTLKNIKRIPVQCPECMRKYRVKCSRVGEMFFCNRCRKETVEIPAPLKAVDTSVPENDIPIITEGFQDYVLDYISKMRPDQRWLFETAPPRKRANGSITPTRHISKSYAARIFSTFAVRSGLSPKYSWHSLRHGQGMLACSVSNGDLSVTMHQLRHSSLAMAQRYAALDPQRKEELRKKFEQRSKGLFKSSAPLKTKKPRKKRRLT